MGTVREWLRCQASDLACHDVFHRLAAQATMLSGFHSRGYLPHIKVEGATYFVTFRLADSLPRETVARLKERREDLLRRAAADSRGPHNHGRHLLFADYAREIDALLDQSTGESWLRRPEVASLVAGALRHFEGGRYQLYAWVVMLNHVHAVVRPMGVHALDAILHSWKSYTASEANRLLNRVGCPFWQSEYYDHWIRDDAEFGHCCRYTEDNPVKAGLSSCPEDWPWSSAHTA
jgi:REP element-mobilizing transposase RayT